MTNSLLEVLAAIVWPLALLTAWLAGEVITARISVPRIAVYSLVGFLLGPSQFGFLQSDNVGLLSLAADLAFGLILFEAGYQVNLHWFLRNPMLLVCGVVESVLTFLGVFGVAQILGMSIQSAALIGALAMATSPASIMRIINDEQASGQLTDRLVHLAVLNCILAVVMLKFVLGWVMVQQAVDWPLAVNGTVLLMVKSSVLGVLAALLATHLSRVLRHRGVDPTLLFVLVVLVVVVISHELRWSPVVASLALGIGMRHRRLVLSRAQAGFGVLGQALVVFLFTYTASLLDWRLAVVGAVGGGVLLLTRSACKLATCLAFAVPGGTSLKKGALLGGALSPLSVFVVLVLEQGRAAGLEGFLGDQPEMVAAVLFMELCGPVLALHMIRLAAEVQGRGGSADAT